MDQQVSNGGAAGKFSAGVSVSALIVSTLKYTIPSTMFERKELSILRALMRIRTSTPGNCPRDSNSMY